MPTDSELSRRQLVEIFSFEYIRRLFTGFVAISHLMKFDIFDKIHVHDPYTLWSVSLWHLRDMVLKGYCDKSVIACFKFRAVRLEI